MRAQVFLGRYQGLRLLGEGGIGRAYLARQTNGDRLVVVKVLQEQYASLKQYRDSFRQEVEVLSRFRHPYAVELYEASLDGPEGPCAVLEYVDGTPLDMLLARDGPFTAARAGRLLGRLCAVLQAAHDQGIIHRDLKPANVMVVAPGTAAERPKLLDFGLARQAHAASQGLYVPLEKFTGSHAHKAVGTPEYTCPEQFRAEEVDHRGDVYSLGVLLYELLTGRLPFQGATTNELVAAHLYQAPPPLTAADGREVVPPALAAVIHGCLAKDPVERPQSARDLALMYGAGLGQPIWDEREATALPSTPAGDRAARDEAEDPNALVYYYEAWMPEQIAALKLRGFVEGRGEVTLTQPGFLRMRLGRPRRVVAAPAPGGFLARLGLVKKPEPTPAFDLMDMDVRVERPDPAQENKLLLTARMHVPEAVPARARPEWQEWCDQVQIDLAAYLMAKAVGGPGSLLLQGQR
jgi:serine/threonine-protein kinase